MSILPSALLLLRLFVPTIIYALPSCPFYTGDLNESVAVATVRGEYGTLADLIPLGPCQLGSLVFGVSNYTNTYGVAASAIQAGFVVERQKVPRHGANEGTLSNGGYAWGFVLSRPWTGNGTISFDYSITFPDISTLPPAAYDNYDNPSMSYTDYWLFGHTWTEGIYWASQPTAGTVTLSNTYSGSSFGSGTVTASKDLSHLDNSERISNPLKGIHVGETITGTLRAAVTGYAGPGPSLAFMEMCLIGASVF